MDLDFEVLEFAQCALSSDKHIVQTPIPLPCGHNICQKCLPIDNKDLSELKCLIQTSNGVCSELRSVDKAKSTKYILKQNLNELFRHVEQRYDKALNSLRNNKSVSEVSIESKIGKIRKEIEARAKKLKFEVDDITKDLYFELETYKKNLINENKVPINILEFEEKLILMRKYKNDEQKTLERLYEFQEDCDKMTKLLSEFTPIDSFQIEFESSDFANEHMTFGQIKCNAYKTTSQSSTRYDLKKLVQDLEMENANLKKETSTMRDESLELRKMIRDMTINYERDQEEITKLNKTIDSLKDEIRVLNHKVTKFDEVKSSINEETEKYRHKSNTLNETIKQQSRRIEDEQNEISRLNTIINKFKDEIKIMNEIIASSNSTIKTLQEENSRLAQTMKSTDNQISQLSEQQKRLENEIKRLNETNCDLCKTRNRIKSNKYRVIDISVSATDACVLPNGCLLIVSYDNDCLVVLNNDYEEIEMVRKINNQTFNPSYATTNEIDRVYVSDRDNGRIIMCDLSFNFLKYSPITSLNPLGLAYADGFVYLCDWDHRKIHKFDSELEQHKSFALDFQPAQIKIIHNVACVKGWNPFSIRFYDVSSFKLLKRYERHFGDILECCSHFIEHSCDNKRFYVFKEDGELLEEIQIHDFNGLIKDDGFSHGITMHNNNLVLTTRNSNKLVIV